MGNKKKKNSHPTWGGKREGGGRPATLKEKRLPVSVQLPISLIEEKGKEQIRKEIHELFQIKT